MSLDRGTLLPERPIVPAPHIEWLEFVFAIHLIVRRNTIRQWLVWRFLTSRFVADSSTIGAIRPS
jgi:hypothetical protein